MTTIVMTGGTSGLGEVAAKRIAATPGTRLLLGGRRTGPAGVDVLPLELTRLDDVRRFAGAVDDRLGPNDIDALVLNAGLSFQTGEARTPDGFETTFAVNHLAQYLLLRLLLPRLATDATVVITTSGTHDPAERTIVPPPRHADATLLAHPELDPQRDDSPKAAGGRAYTSSKLCNMVTVRALAAQPEARERQLTVVAYDPGPTPGTGLSRNSGAVPKVLWSLLGSPLGRLVPRLNTREAAGDALADLTLGVVVPPPGEIYARLRKGRLGWAQPAELALDDETRDALWRDSAALVGLATVGS